MTGETARAPARPDPSGGDRTRHWPAIEARYGRPMSDWLDLMAEHAGRRYPEQMMVLRADHGFSKTHANAVVMYARGSTTSQRFASLDDYLTEADPTGARTVRRILDGLVARHPATSITIAWNQPFLTLDATAERPKARHLFSVGVLTSHLLAAPGSSVVLDTFRERLVHVHGLTVNRKTFRLPLDWDVDEQLLDVMVTAELEHATGQSDTS